MSRPRKWVLLFCVVLLVAFLLLQLRQPERTNPPVLSRVAAPPEILEILERSCFACHSFETDWPWYAYVAPVSWWVVGHVNEGRGDLNFSDWPVFDFEELEDNLGAIDDQIVKGEMPLKSYLILHPGARLSEADTAALREWARPGF